jgi:Flp pilus assembly secretin CpaC
MTFELGAQARKLIGAALVGLAAAIFAGPALALDPIDVTIDFAKLVKLERPASTIVVGNPGIADATIEDETTLVLTGKAAGVTNLIVLDDEGQEITHALVRVSSDVRQLTTVFKAGQRQTYSCAPVCEQVISVGDAPAAFERATTQIQGRQQFATGQ